ncbi:hypothetical protein [Massilia rhizosphaerae]|uniref:hypothetical protein n=1 Tax=Massilia rhizosphaerae TaxID=2784389 RepID=UPI0018DE36E1|nr:hypothetical protein [Massilia rhizosphaerae]
MTTKTPMLALLLCAVAAPVLADDTATQPAKGELVLHRDGSTTMRADSITVAPDGTLAAWMRPVKNAPYSAQVVREHAQTLADGNQIDVRRGPMAYYRDSAGRTRQEFVDGKGELRAVRIDDPAAGVSWTLKPQERVAIKLDRHHLVHDMRKDGPLPSIERHTAPDGQQEVIVKRVVRADAAARRHVEQDVRIQLSKTMAAHGIASLASAFDDAKWSSKAVTKDLGTRDFGGIKAEGRMRSYEIPAGAIGNRNPIVVSDETWTAPDLQVTVYTKHSDPRSGDVVFRLENVKREEPAAALFTVPADYTVREAGARWRDWTSGAVK